MSNPVKNKYAPQEKYQKAHYHRMTVKIPMTKMAAMEALAAERHVSVSYLVKESILQTYGIDCFTQK